MGIKALLSLPSGACHKTLQVHDVWLIDWHTALSEFENKEFE
jgi:hypothetical protein